MKCSAALMLLAMTSLSACAESGRASNQAYCDIASPTYLSKDDKLTPATQRKIIGDNEKGARLCGWKSPTGK
jgi:hypothetical protein